MPVVISQCIPVFADTDVDSFNMTPEGIEKVLSEKTSAIIVGHIAGEMCDMDPIMEIAGSRNIPVIEDFRKWREKYWTQEMGDDVVYDFKSPEGFLDRWGILNPHKYTTKELAQCPRCQLYTDDPEHWCGSVALVPIYDTPLYWTFYYGF